MADEFGASEAIRVLRHFVNDQVPSKVVATTTEIARYALTKAIAMSPFVTGKFMASWRVGVGEPDETYSTTRYSSEGAAAAEALASSSFVGITFGATIYISNSIPYAAFVEYGSPTTEAHYITRRVAQSVGGYFGRI